MPEVVCSHMVQTDIEVTDVLAHLQLDLVHAGALRLGLGRLRQIRQARHLRRLHLQRNIDSGLGGSSVSKQGHTWSAKQDRILAHIHAEPCTCACSLEPVSPAVRSLTSCLETNSSGQEVVRCFKRFAILFILHKKKSAYNVIL